MGEIKKIRELIMVLSSLYLLFFPVLYYSGANSLIVGTYTIIMFIVLSILTVKMITQQNSRNSTR
jgi:hypothetical protein